MARVRTLDLEKQAAERVKEHAIWLASHDERLRQQAEFNSNLDERIANLVSAIGEMNPRGNSPLH